MFEPSYTATAWYVVPVANVWLTVFVVSTDAPVRNAKAICCVPAELRTSKCHGSSDAADLPISAKNSPDAGNDARLNQISAVRPVVKSRFASSARDTNSRDARDTVIAVSAVSAGSRLATPRVGVLL